MITIKTKIQKLAKKYADTLRQQMDQRISDMQSDDNSHYLIYKVLGVSDEEGKLIDEYQNKGRFLYKYAGSFLQDAAILCFEEKFTNAKKKMRIPNTIGSRPKTFEIDCLVGKVAYEIKWRDATTDGDHITKEHTRLKNIKKAGFYPVRIMFYYPNRDQAIRIQEALEAIYLSVKGEYYYGDAAWKYIKKITSIDLKGVLTKIAKIKTKSKK